MRSVRLDEDLDGRVRRAARAEHVSVSEFLRRAASDRAEQILGGEGNVSYRARIAEIIGDVPSTGGGDARRTGAAFTQILAEANEPTRRRVG